MNRHVLTEEKIAEFEKYLQAEEHPTATIEKYMRNIRFFATWLDGRERTYATDESIKICAINGIRILPRRAVINNLFKPLKVMLLKASPSQGK